MLTAFQIDEQRFVRAGCERRTTRNGRSVTLTLWSSICPECDAPFSQAHRERGFIPAKRTLRRCEACRKGPGKRVGQSRSGPLNIYGTLPLNASPSMPQHASRRLDGHSEPPPVNHARQFAAPAWLIQPSKEGGPFPPNQSSKRTKGIFVDR